MPTQQIPQDQWEPFLADFSAFNQTRTVNVEVESPEVGSQTMIDNRPLLAVEPDIEVDDERRRSITVTAGDTVGESPSAITHLAFNPRSIWLKEDDTGRAEALDIETEDGRTIIQFV
jgi:hypothetical protein